MDLVEVQLSYEEETYLTRMTPAQIEEISLDPQKYEELGQKLKEEVHGVVNKTTSTSNECNNATTKQEEKFKWTNDAIKLLLQIRFEMNDQFESPKCKKNKIWMKVAESMCKFGTIVDWSECYAKYRNLLHTYKQNREKRLKKTGEATITWEFYEIFDSVLGNKASTCPPNELLSSSISLDALENSENENYCESMDGSNVLPEIENIEPPKKKIKIREVKKSNMKENVLTLPEYLFIKNKREETIWEEKKKLKEKEIEAINNLASAIRGAN